MNLLLLSPARPRTERFFSGRGDCLKRTEERLLPDDPRWEWMDYAVSFGYRHLLPAEITRNQIGKIINVHISYLPWNRGEDPNLWSFLENTPKGVSVHLIDEGMDTGPILAQQRVAMQPDDTLTTSFQRLESEGEALLISLWEDFVNGVIKPRAQTGEGTTHRMRDKEPWLPCLTHGWETPVRSLEGAALSAQ